ncbi:HAD-IA family hydrolase [Microbacterium murale]|uniref:Sugar-phosphatase n=1 Tax=Microbacterium murale TaxID=1081040 RepID=A0ABU0PBY2_9MICO|nr:HAD-IA family hydrolase [Microbacterium murale]MDQ0644855.1 sugar-phosphatase [Microbacterium murale]
MNSLATLAAALRRGQSITIAGALFDMDGTIVDSIPAVEDAWRIWASEHGIPAPPATMHGKTARAVVTASGLAVGDHERAESRLAEIEARPGQQLNSLPGARQLLEALPHDQWGVVTSAARPVAVARFSATDLPEPAFRITGGDVVHGKPAAEPFLAGVQHLADRGHVGVVIAFEDTVAGATSATSAGCLVVGVLGTDSRRLLESRAHIVLDSLESVRVERSDGRLLIRLT